MYASKKPFDPVKYIQELSIGHEDPEAVTRAMLVMMRQRKIKLIEATRAQLVGLHDLAVEATNKTRGIKPKPLPNWRSGRRTRGYPPRH